MGVRLSLTFQQQCHSNLFVSHLKKIILQNHKLVTKEFD